MSPTVPATPVSAQKRSEDLAKSRIDSKALSTQRQMWLEDATIALLLYHILAE
jgi:hypothetical protein